MRGMSAYTNIYFVGFPGPCCFWRGGRRCTRVCLVSLIARLFRISHTATHCNTLPCTATHCNTRITYRWRDCRQGPCRFWREGERCVRVCGHAARRRMGQGSWRELVLQSAYIYVYMYVCI